MRECLTCQRSVLGAIRGIDERAFECAWNHNAVPNWNRCSEFSLKYVVNLNASTPTRKTMNYHWYSWGLQPGEVFQRGGKNKRGKWRDETEVLDKCTRKSKLNFERKTRGLIEAEVTWNPVKNYQLFDHSAFWLSSITNFEKMWLAEGFVATSYLSKLRTFVPFRKARTITWWPGEKQTCYCFVVVFLTICHNFITLTLHLLHRKLFWVIFNPVIVAGCVLN